MQATKQNTINTINNALIGIKGYLHTDGIQYDLDGKSLAEWIENCGYKVTSYTDTGRNGEIVLDNGVSVSTNGYTS